MIKRIIREVFFPFGNHFSKSKNIGDRSEAHFRPDGLWDWVFVVSHFVLIIYWLDNYIARAHWELGVIRNGILILGLYLKLLFLSYPIRILYMRPSSFPHRFFWQDKWTEYPFSKRFERFYEGNLPNFMGIMVLWPSLIYHFIDLLSLNPFLITYLDDNLKNDATRLVFEHFTPLSTNHYLAQQFSAGDFRIIAVYNVIVIVLIFSSYLFKSRGFKRTFFHN